MIKNINFVSKFRRANLASVVIFILSIFFISFKGLNYGIDFKGGTLIELRVENNIDASSIRESLNSMDLGDINVIFSQKSRELIDLEERGVIKGNREQENTGYLFSSTIMEWWVIKEVENTNVETLKEREKVFLNLIIIT